MSEVEVLIHKLDQMRFTLTVEGDGIGVTPISELSERLRGQIVANKPALIAALLKRCADRIAETKTSLEALYNAPAWRGAWIERFRASSSKGDIDAVQRAVGDCLGVAQQYAAIGDFAATRSACALVLDCANGRQWEMGLRPAPCQK